MLPYYDELTSMHDNASIHTSYAARELACGKGVETLDGPSCSPDLNLSTTFGFNSSSSSTLPIRER